MNSSFGSSSMQVNIGPVLTPPESSGGDCSCASVISKAFWKLQVLCISICRFQNCKKAPHLKAPLRHPCFRTKYSTKLWFSWFRTKYISTEKKDQNKDAISSKKVAEHTTGTGWRGKLQFQWWRSRGSVTEENWGMEAATANQVWRQQQNTAR